MRLELSEAIKSHFSPFADMGEGELRSRAPKHVTVVRACIDWPLSRPSSVISGAVRITKFMTRSDSINITTNCHTVVPEPVARASMETRGFGRTA